MEEKLEIAFLKERVDKLENFFSGKIKNPIYETLHLYVEYFNKRINNVEKGLEDYREYRTDIEDLGTDVMYIKQRLDKIEDYLKEIKLVYSNPLQQEVWQENISKRLEELETVINIIRDLASRGYNPKKPYACPICQGKGQLWNETVIKFDKCHPCEGGGIVWG